MERAGTVITRQALLEEVWDMNWFGSTKTLDVHMSGLRRSWATTLPIRSTSTRFAGSASASPRPTKHEPPDAAARGVRLRAAGRDRRLMVRWRLTSTTG